MADRALTWETLNKTIEEFTEHQTNILIWSLLNMPNERPPTIDPAAAARWARLSPLVSPWLHEEVGRRMESRLQWIVSKPARWVHWEPVRGGLKNHALLARRYPSSECFVVQSAPVGTSAELPLVAPWWKPARWSGPRVRLGLPQQPVQMVWANMVLHMESDPLQLLQCWHQLLDLNGFLMFSCLGPDTLSQLREVYETQGWPPPSHEFTDMHDWGDMLVRSGFAEPVMDMERINLTFSSTQNLIEELRGLGRNLHPARFGGLRSKGWRNQLSSALQSGLSDPSQGGRLGIQFEIIYGHAFKPQRKFPVRPESALTLDEMRAALSKPKT